MVQNAAGVDNAEMYRTFNMGLGMVVAVPADQAQRAVATVDGLGFGAGIVGEVTAGGGRCLLE